jgi:hypothetical protein
MAEPLPSKCKVMSSNPSIVKKKKKKGRGMSFQFKEENQHLILK